MDLNLSRMIRSRVAGVSTPILAKSADRYRWKFIPRLLAGVKSAEPAGAAREREILQRRLAESPLKKL